MTQHIEWFEKNDMNLFMELKDDFDRDNSVSSIENELTYLLPTYYLTGFRYPINSGDENA